MTGRAPWFAALRERPVVAPDAHSVTRFAPYVTLAPEELSALIDIAEAAEQVRRAMFPDDRQAWSAQECRLSEALEAANSQERPA